MRISSKLLEVKNLDKRNIRLTSTEISNLLTQFEQETMAICIGNIGISNGRGFSNTFALQSFIRNI